VRASGVELHPTTSGVRAVTGEVVITATSGGVAGEAHFERAGVDVDLPGGRIRRAVASAGTLTVARGEERFRLGDLVVQHGVEAGQTRIDGRANGETVSVSLARSEGGALAIEAKLPALPVGLVPDGIRPPWVLPAGTLGGALQAHRQAGVWDVAVDLHGQGVELAHELLATEPVRVGAVEIAATATWDRERHEGRVSGALTHERVTVEIDGALGETGAEVTARLARVPCQALLVALPDAIKAPLAGLALDGTIGAEVKATAPRTAEAELTIGMDFGCRALAEAAGKDPRDLLGGDAYPHRLPDGQERRFGRRDADFVALDHLPRHVAAAFVSAEDGRFFSHRGIDPIELGRSFAADVAVRKPVRGGSTLTQQLAKNLWLGRDRTVGRKLVEAVLAWRLESVVGKRRILEIYLSVIELGEGVWGVAQGSRRWFDLPPARLSVTQAAFLAAITPEPRSAEKRIREAGKLDPRTRDRVRIILGAMKKDRAIDRETYERALGELARLRVEVGDLRKASR
jgi:hypothetical protein